MGETPGCLSRHATDRADNIVTRSSRESTVCRSGASNYSLLAVGTNEKCQQEK